MKRLFFALWPDEKTRQQCGDIIQKLSGAGLRPVAAKNLHVTLVFLGNIDDEREAAVTAAAGALNVPSGMSVTFDRLSFWKKPAIYCLTGSRFDASVAELVEQLSAIAFQYGIQVDERPFRPHVTLARKARAAVDIDFKPIIWRADDFCLVQSCSTKDGVEYRVIRRWPGKQTGLTSASQANLSLWRNVMPYLKLSTNVEISQPQASQLLKDLSKLVAQGTGKPEQYVMVELAGGKSMAFGGSSEPLAYLECKSIGLTSVQAKALSASLNKALTAGLSLAADRIYIEFSNCPAELWGWNGTTFG
ncbi:MAG: RNA 2',3'-cyclic phosphodiesterase [Methylomonas sp.]